jgi:hypothetical protein
MAQMNAQSIRRYPKLQQLIESLEGTVGTGADKQGG